MVSHLYYVSTKTSGKFDREALMLCHGKSATDRGSLVWHFIMAQYYKDSANLSDNHVLIIHHRLGWPSKNMQQWSSKTFALASEAMKLVSPPSLHKQWLNMTQQKSPSHYESSICLRQIAHFLVVFSISELRYLHLCL